MSEPGTKSGAPARREASDLESMLSSLPRSEATPGFTDAVLSRLRKPAPETRAPRFRDWAWGGLAIAAAVVLGAILAPYLASRDLAGEDAAPRSDASRVAAPRPSAVRAVQPSTLPRVEVAALRDELRALEDELATLRQLVAASSPVVGLGTSDRVDYVVDLRDLIGGGEPVPVSQPVGNR